MRPRRWRRGRSPAGESERNSEVGRRGGVPTAGCPAGCRGVREVGAGVWGPKQVVSCRARLRIVKVSRFRSARLCAGSGRESPPRTGDTGLGGAPRLHPQLFDFSEPPRPRRSPSCRRSPPPRRLVTLRAAVLGPLSLRPGRVTPLIPGFGPTGAPRAESGGPASAPDHASWLMRCHYGRCFPRSWRAASPSSPRLPSAPPYPPQCVHGCFSFVFLD